MSKFPYTLLAYFIKVNLSETELFSSFKATRLIADNLLLRNLYSIATSLSLWLGQTSSAATGIKLTSSNSNREGGPYLSITFDASSPNSNSNLQAAFAEKVNKVIIKTKINLLIIFINIYNFYICY